jgi:hypothetical protein
VLDCSVIKIKNNNNKGNGDGDDYQEDNEDEKMTIESKFYNNSKMKTKR